ncbi:MAG: DegT/DnrJ/EryC1/StrS family aminotransferase, partial [Gammaproteobacteria bacterium]
QAFALSGANAKNAVLIPAYHCGSMVEPAIWTHTEILLYRLEPDLSPCQQHIEKLIDNSKNPIRAMLLPHYFGFPQDIETWRSFCDSHNIDLIEDCAHAFFGTSDQNKPLGTIGNYAVASVRKFFSSPDGGILIGNNSPSNPLATTKPTFKTELRELLRGLSVSAAYGKLGALGSIIEQINRWRARPKQDRFSDQSTSNNQARETTTWQWIDPGTLNLEGLRVSKQLMKHSDIRYIKAARRKHYIQLLEGIREIQYLTPLFPELPDHVIPYMFPVILDSERTNFGRLKRAGIPIWRWEELAESDCAISQHYRLHLLQLPCHQDLTTTEMNWIIKQLGEILGTRRS